MSLIKRNANLAPYFSSVFDDFFGRDWADYRNTLSGGSMFPAVNVRDENDRFVVEVAAPGLNKEDFKLELNQRVLSISSKKESQAEEKDQKGTYSRREFSYSSFSRSFTLPERVKKDGISAKYENGVLYVHIPKQEAVEPNPARVIDIS